MRARIWLLGSMIVLLIVCIGIATATIILTRGMLFAGGVSLEGISFAAGDIPDVPAYPNTEQITASTRVIINIPVNVERRVGVRNPPADMLRLAETLRNPQWKYYRTDDSPDKVLSWYDQAMAREGWGKDVLRETGVVVYGERNPLVALYIWAASGKTHILLLAGIPKE